jgi:hypothetical protein
MNNLIVNSLRVQYRDLEMQVREGIQARRGQVDFLTTCRSRCLRYEAYLEQVCRSAHVLASKMP